MIVTRESLASVALALWNSNRTTLALDCETTGLLESDSLFSLIIAGDETYYFNFNPLHADCLPRDVTFAMLQRVFVREDITWFLQNAKFDMRMLAKEGAFLAGKVHCTHAVERVIQNNYFGKDAYSLHALAARRGWAKDDAVKKYISEHRLYTWVDIPGKKKRVQLPHYDKVPLDVIVPYGEQDAKVTLDIGHDQVSTIAKYELGLAPGAPLWRPVVENEKSFTKTAFKMERAGVRIDKAFVAKALLYEMDNVSRLKREFTESTGAEFVDSNKPLQLVFDKLGETYPMTDKGNPSFASDVLEDMTSPVAQMVNSIRYHEKRAGTYYSSFLYYAGDGEILHPDVRQAGTETGRCSYRDPNLQNVPKEDDPEDLATLYHVRDSFIPRPGHFFYSIDYQQQEFRMMLDYAGEKRLIKEINEGADVHDATAILCGITRKQAKTINFGLIYGMGKEKLAAALGLSVKESQELKLTYFGKLPRVQAFIADVIAAGERRGYVHNWLGRRCHINRKDWAYVLPNHLIQGGCADVIKVAMNQIDGMLEEERSPTKMLLQVHDELLLETPMGDERVIEKVKAIMENVYPSKNGMRLTTAVEHSLLGWGVRNKIKGTPYGTTVSQVF